MILIENNIILRRLKDSDKNALATLANNRNIWNNVRDSLPSPYTEKDAEEFIHLVKEEKVPISFAIEYKKQFCGMIGLVAQSDVYRRTAEIGYWLGEPFWNKGIATVAVKLITGYGLNTLDFSGFIQAFLNITSAQCGCLKRMAMRKMACSKNQLLRTGKSGMSTVIRKQSSGAMNDFFYSR